jgi:putative sigma-54 modulation protein
MQEISALNIQIAGRSDDVTHAMKENAQEKVAKLFRFYDRITWIDVVLDAEGVHNSAEVSVGLNQGLTLVGKAETDDMYSAIDQAVEKVGRQVRRHKEKQHDHRYRRPEPAVDLPPDEPIPSFDEALDELDQHGG